MFCTNCGANISENEKFCTNCGARQVVEETVKEMANAGVNVQGAQVADINEDVYAQAEMSGTNEQGQTVHDFEQAVDTDMPIEKPKKKKGFKKKAIIAVSRKLLKMICILLEKGQYCDPNYAVIATE